MKIPNKGNPLYSSIDYALMFLKHELVEGWFNFNFILILKIKNTYPNPNLFKTLILIPIFSNTTPLSNTHSKKCTFIFLFV